MGIDLPDNWKFMGIMWWVLHIIAIVIIFTAGYLIGKFSAEPEPDPVDQDELRKQQHSRKEDGKT